MKRFSIVLLLIVIYSCACPSVIKEYNSTCEKTSIIKRELRLSKSKFKIIKKNDSIISELYTSIKDTVSIPLINRRLDSFLMNSYTRKEFLSSLKIDRAFKHKIIPLEIDRRTNVSNLKSFDNAKDAASKDKEVIKSLKANSEFNTNKIKDSLN